jgi:hypothetical protein
MESDPMLEEMWRVKDAWAREATDEVHRLCQSTCKGAAEHLHPGPLGGNGKQLWDLAAEMEQQRAEASALVLKHAPPQRLVISTLWNPHG